MITMNNEIYKNLCLNTKSDLYCKENININDLKQTLKRFVEISYELDRIKSLLYYGKDKNLSVPVQFYTNLENINLDNINPDIFHGIIGLATESSELIEEVIKPIQDYNNYIGELGDCNWFMNIIYNQIDTNADEVQVKNIMKLATRYGDKFDKDRAIIRDLEKEYDSYSKTTE